MTKEERLNKIEELKKQAATIKKEVDYYNALQLALKLVLNGSYGAFATPYFILYTNHVAGTITAEGRELTRTMDKVNQDYWYDQWHLDTEFHKKLGVKNVTPIDRSENVSIYGDTDSIFVSFKPCMDHCEELIRPVGIRRTPITMCNFGGLCQQLTDPVDVILVMHFPYSHGVM